MNWKRSELINIPIFNINGFKESKWINALKRHEEIFVIKLTEDHNPWVFKRTWTYQLTFIAIGVLSFVTSIISMQYLRILITTSKKGQKSIAKVALAIEIVSNAERGFYLFVDPFFSTGRLSVFWSNMLMSASAPWGLVTSLLVALFWSDLVNMQKVNTIRKHKRHLLIAVCIICVGDFILSLARAHDMDITTAADFSVGLLAVASLIIGIFFVDRGYLFLKTVSSLSNNSDSQKILAKATKWIVVSGVCTIFQLCGYFTLFFWMWTPIGWFVGFAMVSFSWVTTSFTQVMAWNPHQGVGSISKKQGASVDHVPTAVSSAKMSTNDHTASFDDNMSS